MRCLDKQAILDCTLCSLHKGVTNKVIGKGSLTPKILFIGEAPGAKEDETGIPFIGPAGKQLDKMVEYLGLSKKDYAVINMIKCRPPNNRDPTGQEIEACKPFLKSQIEELNPKVIILLGNVSEKAISIVPLTRGKVYMFSGYTVIKVFHPAALLYQASRISEQKQYLDNVRDWL